MTISVPENASFENFRKQAKSLRRQHSQRSSEAAKRIRNSDRSLATLGDEAIHNRPLSLSNAQFVVAQEYGFESWTKLKRHMEGLAGSKSLTERFVQAINGGGVETVRELFENNPQEREQLIEAKDEFGRSVLQLATFRSRSRKFTPNVELLLENGAEMDLWSACGLGDLAAIDAYLDKYPQALNQTVHDVFPIQYPILTNRPEVVGHLLNRGEDPNRPLRKAHWFVWDEYFVEKGLYRWTPLLMAGIWGRIEIFDILLEAGADLSATSTLGNNAIHWAAIQSRIPLIQRNLDAGVDIDLASSSAEPAEIAAYRVAATDVKGNFSGRSNSQKFKEDGCTPFHFAVLEGHAETMEWLIDKGASLSKRNTHGATILHLAAAPFQGEYAEVFNRVMALAPGDLNAVDDDGLTPLDYAMQANHNATVEILKDAGAVCGIY